MAVNSITSKIPELSPPCRNKPPFGRLHTNCIKWVTWYWTYDLLKVGSKRELVVDDVDDIDPHDSTQLLLEKLTYGWNEQLKQNPTNPSLWWTIMHVIGYKRFWWLVFVQCFYYCIIVINIILLFQILEFLNGDNSGQHTLKQFYYAIGYCVAMLCCNVTNTCIHHW